MPIVILIIALATGAIGTSFFKPGLIDAESLKVQSAIVHHIKGK